jgi:proteasome lid subunit RPN8/RPN11
MGTAVRVVTMNEHPWLDGDVEITRDVLAELDAHAVAEYPNESCGFLTGPADAPARVDRALRAANLADKYHRVDPATFPRTARTFYMIDARLIVQSFEQGARAGQPVKAIYHSHCDVGAYFSAEDQAGAAPDGALAYPVVYVVTSVRDGVVDDRKVFTLRDGRWAEGTIREV